MQFYFSAGWVNDCLFFFFFFCVHVCHWIENLKKNKTKPCEVCFGIICCKLNNLIVGDGFWEEAVETERI